MAIRGITFPKQIVSSNDDAHIYGILLNGKKGRTKGCKMTFATDDIYISEGYFFVANRLVEISSAETIATPIVTTTTYCRLVFEVNLSETNTTDAFNQGTFKILTGTTDYPTIKQEDLEIGGAIFQLPFAHFIKTVSGINAFVSELETIGTVRDTVYVSKSGNDASGDGTQDAPFATIQAAVNSIPKYLNGYNVEISIASGTYSERVIVDGFFGGKLVIGKSGEVFTITGGINIVNCSFVETNIYQIRKTDSDTQALFVVKDGSNVTIGNNMILDGVDSASNGMLVDNNSHAATKNNITLTINNCSVALTAQWCSFVSMTTITGSENVFGMIATQGSIVSFKTDSLSKMWSNAADSGGLVLTGSNSSALSDATLDL